MLYHEEISRWSQARKVLRVPRGGLRGELWLYLGEYEGNTTPLGVSLNGKPLVGVKPDPKRTGFNWVCVPIRAGLLKNGDNEFVIATRSDRPGTWMLGVAPVRGRTAKASVVSLDDGRTWHGDAMGPHRLFAGEYLARLYLPDLPDKPARPRFVFEDFDHPQLAAMRRHFKLDAVVRGKKHTFEKVRALMSCVAKLWLVRVGGRTPSGRPATGSGNVCPWNTLLTADWMSRDTVQGCPGQRPVAFCVHYGIAMVQCCAALGIYARPVIMEQCHPQSPSGHFCCEVWIPEWQRWVYVDPDQDSAYRIGEEYLNLAQIADLSIQDRFGEIAVERGPAYGYDPRIATGGFERFDRFQGYRRWGVYPRTDFLANPGIHPVQNGDGNYRFPGFYWYRDPRLEPRHYFPYYVSDLDALYAPPPVECGGKCR